MLSNARRQCGACLLSNRVRVPAEKALEMSRLRQQMPDLYAGIHYADCRSTIRPDAHQTTPSYCCTYDDSNMIIGLSFASCDFTDAHPAQTTNQTKDPAQHREASSCTAGRTLQVRLTCTSLPWGLCPRPERTHLFHSGNPCLLSARLSQELSTANSSSSSRDSDCDLKPPACPEWVREGSRPCSRTW